MKIQDILIQISYPILTLFSFVILSSSKDRVLMQDNLRRIPSHFDKACPELAEGLSVTVDNNWR